MLATIKCEFQGCGYRSKSGFCLNRLTVISDQGVCKYLTKPGWQNPIEEEWKKNTYIPPREDWKEKEKENALLIEEKRGPTVEEFLAGAQEGKDGPPRD